MNEPSTLGTECHISAFILGYLAVDFICTMLNRYVFKDEIRNNEK